MTLPVVDAAALRVLTVEGALGAATGRPLVVIEDDDDESLRGWSPGSVPAVFVALREPGSHADVQPDHPCDLVVAADDPGLEVIVDNVQRHPVAATSAAVLLRSTPWADVEAGLSAESAVYSTLQAGSEFANWLRRRPSPAHATDTDPLVIVERDGDDLTITLNRPTSHNAVNEPLRTALAEALTVAVLDPSIEHVLLRGNGPSYCSGGDLREFGSFPDVATAHVSRLARNPGRLAALISERLHVELHGACLGAGIEVPAFAGHVTATAGCRIGLPELGIGLIPGAGGTVSLPRRIGRHRTLLLALTAEPVDERTALAWGLIDHIAAG